MAKIVQILVICVFTITFTVAAQAATFVVNTANDTLDATPGDGTCADSGGACSLRAAISEANALVGDDIITLPAGTYTQSLIAANDDANAGGDWDVTSVITINGAGAATTILQANATIGVATERVLNVRPGGNLTLNLVTVRHGRFTGTMTAATRGAGIENNATLTLNNVIVRDNQINSTSGNPIGAGIHNAGASLTLNNTTVTSNSNVRVSGGSAFGGGITSIVPATINITGSSISANSSTSQAGGFGFGAGLYLESAFNVTATNSNFDNNVGSGTSGSNGNGVRALASAGAATFNATNCTFSGNTSGATGLNQGTGIQFFTVTAAANTLTAVLDGVTINGNAGNSIGVGINSTLSTGGAQNVTIRNTTISNNTGASNGGGMSISNTGGGAAATGTFNIVNSTISGNIANGNGGGLFFEQPTAQPITVNLNFATISNNRANNDNTGVESGGGIFHAATGTLNMKNSVVADNTIGSSATAPDISGGVVSQDYNHIEDTTGATISGTTTNNSTGDPLLGALAANGGPTQTHLPGLGSPLINAIPNATNDCGGPITTDQRGITRPAGGSCDKGSVEVATASAPATIAGQVLTNDGRGIRNVTVMLSGGGLPQPLFVQTGQFGNFQFSGIPTGQVYTLSISAKRYTFAMPARNISLTGDTLNENFVAEPGFGNRSEEDSKTDSDLD